MPVAAHPWHKHRSKQRTPASGGDKQRPVAAISRPCQQRTPASGGDKRMRPSPPRPPRQSYSFHARKIDKTKLIFTGGHECDGGRSPSKQGRPASGGDKRMRGQRKSPSWRSSSSSGTSSSLPSTLESTRETDKTKMPPSGCHRGDSDRRRSPNQHRSEQGAPASGGDTRMVSHVSFSDKSLP